MMTISRKWFAEINAEQAREAASADTVLASALGKVVEAIDKYDGNLEKLQTRAFLASIDALRDAVEKVLDADSAIGNQHEPWLVSHDLLTLRMHLFTAYACRLTAEKILKERASILIADEGSWRGLDAMQFQTLGAWMVETGDKKFLGSLSNVHQSLSSAVRAEVRPFMRGISLAVGDGDSYRQKSASAITDAEKGYARYMSGKRVAIVGPADTGRKNGAEIDAYDVVVRFNHFDGAEYRPEKFGSRTDVSYYTDPAFKKVVLKTESKLDGLSFACVQRTDTLTQEQIESVSATIRGQYRRSNSVFFKSHANALQRFLFDIARFDVKEIKAFNMDMWVTPHDKNYMARRGKLDPHMFIHHDLVANFVFTKRAVAGGVLFVDDILGRVLLMKPRDYILRLELLHGETFRTAQDSVAT